eukprot:1511543-Prymnesium_polylepis.1
MGRDQPRASQELLETCQIVHVRRTVCREYSDPVAVLIVPTVVWLVGSDSFTARGVIPAIDFTYPQICRCRRVANHGYFRRRLSRRRQEPAVHVVAVRPWVLSPFAAADEDAGFDQVEVSTMKASVHAIAGQLIHFAVAQVEDCTQFARHDAAVDSRYCRRSQSVIVIVVTSVHELG